jgi:hypothetical protein
LAKATPPLPQAFELNSRAGFEPGSGKNGFALIFVQSRHGWDSISMMLANSATAEPFAGQKFEAR